MLVHTHTHTHTHARMHVQMHAHTHAHLLEAGWRRLEALEVRDRTKVSLEQRLGGRQMLSTSHREREIVPNGGTNESKGLEFVCVRSEYKICNYQQRSGECDRRDMTRVFACLQLITSAASVLSRGPQARVPKCRVQSCKIFSLLLPFLFFTICHKYHFTGTVISLLQAPWLFLATHGMPHSLQVLSKQEMVGQGHTLSSDSWSWPPTKTLRH